MIDTMFFIFFACGIALGFVLALYQKHLVKKYLTEEYEDSFISKPKFAPISAVASGVLWAICEALYFKTNVYEAIVCGLACSVMLCIFSIDLHHCIIFDRFQISLLVLGIAKTVIEYFYKTGWGYESNIIGAVAGLVSFLAVFLIGSLIMKREVMGFGDVKLAACAGLFLGWQKFTFAMFFATVVGSIVLLTIRKVKGDEKFKEYPFAPFIVAGIIISMFFGTPIIKAYISLLIA